MKREVEKRVWFKPVRGSYLPASTVGWLTYIPFTGYLVFSFIVGLAKTPSVYMAVIVIFPNCVAATAVLTYIAAKKS